MAVSNAVPRGIAGGSLLNTSPMLMMRKALPKSAALRPAHVCTHSVAGPLRAGAPAACGCIAVLPCTWKSATPRRACRDGCTGQSRLRGGMASHTGLGISAPGYTGKVWQTLNIGKAPGIPNNLIISGAVHGQMSRHCLGVAGQTLPVLR